MRFITRERLHVDRIATAWAIRRFVDRDATFAFVPRTKDVSGMDGTPFDIRGAALSHHGDRCTFEVLLDTYRLTDPSLQRMARIVHGADLPHDDDVPPASAELRATFDALRDGDLTDDERLTRGFSVCDVLFASFAAA